LEGGTRTPFIAWWPGRIKPGVSDQIVCTVDLAASLSALVGDPIRDGGCSDSQNVLLALLGDSSARGRESLVQQDNSGRSLGFRKGNWKLVRTPRQGHPQPDDSDVESTFQYQLFDLAEDPAEKSDLVESNPAKVAEMKELLRQILEKGDDQP
jgi:arylsulfatase A